MKPTRKQAQLLASIWRFKATNQISPSFTEIRSMMGVSSYQSVVDMLGRLEVAGWVSKEAGEARSLLLTERAKDYLMAMGVGQVLNVELEVGGYSTNKILAQNSNSTQTDHNRAVANTSISYKASDEPNIPQQLSMFDLQNGAIKSTSTINNSSNPSFNTVAVHWMSGILDATSTAAVTQVKDFFGYFFHGPLIQFILLKKLTSFTFSEIVLVVALSLIFFPIITNLIKDKYVSSN